MKKILLQKWNNHLKRTKVRLIRPEGRRFKKSVYQEKMERIISLNLAHSWPKELHPIPTAVINEKLKIWKYTKDIYEKKKNEPCIKEVMDIGGWKLKEGNESPDEFKNEDKILPMPRKLINTLINLYQCKYNNHILGQNKRHYYFLKKIYKESVNYNCKIRIIDKIKTEKLNKYMIGVEQKSGNRIEVINKTDDSKEGIMRILEFELGVQSLEVRNYHTIIETTDNALLNIVITIRGTNGINATIYDYEETESSESETTAHPIIHTIGSIILQLKKDEEEVEAENNTFFKNWIFSLDIITNNTKKSTGTKRLEKKAQNQLFINRYALLVKQKGICQPNQETRSLHLLIDELIKDFVNE